MKFLKQSLVAASVIAIVAGLLSRIIGYAREAVIANYFGTGSELDTFLIAFIIPELTSTVAYSSLPTALIPALKKIRNNSQINDTSLYFTGMVLFAFLFAMVTAAVFIFKGTIFHLLAPDFPEARYSTGIDILSIVAFCIFFGGMETYFRGWLFEKKHFIVPTSSGIVFNIIILVSLVTLFPNHGIDALALGWLLGSITLFLYNGLFSAGMVGLRGPVSFDFSWAGLLLKSVLIIIIVQLIPFLYVPIDRFLAANYLNIGYISALKYAQVLHQLPIGIFIVAFNVAAFPWISDYSSTNNNKSLVNLYHESIRLIVFIIGFTSIGIILFSSDIVSIAFERGRFDSISLKLTSEPLRIYAVGAIFAAISIFQMRFYLARRALFRLGAISMSSLVIKIIFSVILIVPLEQNGLALATVISWIWGSFIMGVDLNRIANLGYREIFSNSLTKILLNILAVGIFWVGFESIWPYKGSSSFSDTMLRFFTMGISGLVLYAGLSSLLRIPEFIKVYNSIKKRVHL